LQGTGKGGEGGVEGADTCDEGFEELAVLRAEGEGKEAASTGTVSQRGDSAIWS